MQDLRAWTTCHIQYGDCLVSRGTQEEGYDLTVIIQ